MSGCGKFYWNKAGAGADDFAQDSRECAHENFLFMGGRKDVGIVLEDRYKACLTSRGWVRGQHLEPPPGWFRGIEGNQPVKYE